MADRRDLTGRLGRYIIVRKLGAGGMGQVYLAEDTQLGRKVALKVPFPGADDPHAVDRFRREATVAARIDHPYLCPVFDFGAIDGVLFFTMPYIEGTLLSHLIEDDKPWPAARAIDLVRKLAQGVEHLHQRGIIHRDLKPANVIVRHSGEPVVMDFGLARSFTGQAQQLTTVGQPLGAPAYMAPEQVLGQRDIGPAVDVYGLAMILYELLTATRPFEGPVSVIFAQVLNALPPRPSSLCPDLDARIDAVCLKALSKNPRERPASAEAFAAELAQLAALQSTAGESQPIQVPLLPAEPAKMDCPRCGRSARVSAALVGRKVKCPHCGERLGRLPR